MCFKLAGWIFDEGLTMIQAILNWFMNYVIMESEHRDRLLSFHGYPSIIEDDRAGPMNQSHAM